MASSISESPSLTSAAEFGAGFFDDAIWLAGVPRFELFRDSGLSSSTEGNGESARVA
jgi:hypothetical protein